MSLSYLGGAASFHEVSNSGLSEDFWDFDVLTRAYEGPPSKLEAFRRAWPKGKQDPEFPWLFLVSRPVSKLSPVVEASLIFKGILGKDSKEKAEGSVRLQPLTLKGLTLNGTAQYYGPVSTWRYITTEQPFAPAHPGELLQTAFDYQIINQRGSTGKVGVSANRGVGDSTAIPTGYSFLVKPRVVTSRFDFEQVGGCWQVTEENEGRLESFFLTGQ